MLSFVPGDDVLEVTGKDAFFSSFTSCFFLFTDTKVF